METYEVLDWMEKLDDGPRFTLVCPVCYGELETCAACDGRGYIVPLTARAWATTLRDVDDDARRKVLDYNIMATVDATTGYVVLAPLAVGGDMTPNMAAALLALGYTRLPAEWAIKIADQWPNLVASAVGDDMAERLRHMAIISLLDNMADQQAALRRLAVQ